jgi:hypothetical protein
MTLAPDAAQRIDDDVVPKRLDHFTLRRSACCFTLVDNTNRRVLKLNRTSALLWELCTGEWNVGEMLDVLKESFPDSAADVVADVHRVLAQFRDEQVITLD